MLGLSVSSFVTALKVAAGMLVVAFANDTYVSPTVEHMVPTLEDNHTLSKAADTATCAATTGVLGWFGDLIHREIGRAIYVGGGIYTAIKAYTTVIPGVEAKITVPNPLSVIRAQKALTGQAPSKDLKGTTSSALPAPTNESPTAGDIQALDKSIELGY